MSETHVKIAEVKIGSTGDVLRACLGSCVGIAFVWKEKNICGMAHCFLPEGIDEESMISAKYVNQGIESLMSLMKIKKDNVKDIEVYVAGGSNMMNQLIKSKIQVGKHNTESTAKWLAHHGFVIKKSYLDLGRGIKVIVNCTDFSVELIPLEDSNYQLWKAS